MLLFIEYLMLKKVVIVLEARLQIFLCGIRENRVHGRRVGFSL
jgi:hypothetical protein